MRQYASKYNTIQYDIFCISHFAINAMPLCISNFRFGNTEVSDPKCKHRIIYIELCFEYRL